MSETVQLKTKHFFRLLLILNKVGFTKQAKVLFTGVNLNKAELKGLSDEEKKEKLEQTQRAITADLMVMVLENLDKAEKEVYGLLADLFGKTVEEIEEQKLGETIGQINAVFTSTDFADFFDDTTA